MPLSIHASRARDNIIPQLIGWVGITADYEVPSARVERVGGGIGWDLDG